LCDPSLTRTNFKVSIEEIEKICKYIDTTKALSWSGIAQNLGSTEEILVLEAIRQIV
jgi:hypothetical protein